MGTPTWSEFSAHYLDVTFLWDLRQGLPADLAPPLAPPPPCLPWAWDLDYSVHTAPCSASFLPLSGHARGSGICPDKLSRLDQHNPHPATSQKGTSLHHTTFSRVPSTSQDNGWNLPDTSGNSCARQSECHSAQPPFLASLLQAEESILLTFTPQNSKPLHK